MSELIESSAGGITTLTMNRPAARNAMSGEMMEGLHEALPRLAQDSSVRLVVLTGAGNAFCAGGDVKSFASSAQKGGAPSSPEMRAQGLRTSMELSNLLHTMAKPTLAVIPGPAAGAGLSLALACDLRIAADTAKLTTAFSKVGLSGDYGGSYFLTQLVGTAKARELYFTADVILAPEACALGIINKVVPAADLEAEALAYAQKIAGLPTIALGYMKKNLNMALHGSLSDVLDLEAPNMIRCFSTNDHKNAAVAFVNKQKPKFEGN